MYSPEMASITFNVGSYPGTYTVNSTCFVVDTQTRMRFRGAQHSSTICIQQVCVAVSSHRVVSLRNTYIGNQIRVTEAASTWQGGMSVVSYVDSFNRSGPGNCFWKLLKSARRPHGVESSHSLQELQKLHWWAFLSLRTVPCTFVRPNHAVIIACVYQLHEKKSTRSRPSPPFARDLVCMF